MFDVVFQKQNEEEDFYQNHHRDHDEGKSSRGNEHKVINCDSDQVNHIRKRMKSELNRFSGLIFFVAKSNNSRLISLIL